jgi:hypothetical protein
MRFSGFLKLDLNSQADPMQFVIGEIVGSLTGCERHSW